MKALLITLASGVLFFLSQGPADTWLLAWVAPLPLLWFAYGGASRWQVVLASLGGFALGQLYLVQCYWGLIPATVVLPLVITMGAAFAAAVAFSSEAYRRGSAWGALLGFPALWTAIEYGIAKVSPHGSFGALGYSQVSFPAAIQVAALFGVHAVTFLLCLFASAVAVLLRRRLAAGAVGIAVCGVAVVLGFTRLADTEGPRVRLAALASAEVRNAQNRERTVNSELAATEMYAAAVRQLPGVQVIAIPEGAIRMQDGNGTGVLKPLAAAAGASGALVVVGTVTPTQNRAFALLPDGTLKAYAKRHLLVPLEAGVPGTAPGLLGAGYATQICKDMDFAGTVRTTAEHGVHLMIVPADDFGGDGWIHARMAIMRGVENGFAVLRSAFDGLATISDAQGRVLARASTMQPGMVVIQAEAPLGAGPTLYTRTGDAFSWLCTILALALGVRVFLARAARRSPGATSVDSATGRHASHPG
jgi:apolipoprotein N-acyltransferase